MFHCFSRASFCSGGLQAGVLGLNVAPGTLARHPWFWICSNGLQAGPHPEDLLRASAARLATSRFQNRLRQFPSTITTCKLILGLWLGRCLAASWAFHRTHGSPAGGISIEIATMCQKGARRLPTSRSWIEAEETRILIESAWVSPCWLPRPGTDHPQEFAQFCGPLAAKFPDFAVPQNGPLTLEGSFRPRHGGVASLLRILAKQEPEI